MVDKKKIVIDNYFKSDCTIDTTIREAYRKGFERALQKLDVHKTSVPSHEQDVKKELVDKAIKELEEYLQDADKCISEDSEYIHGWKSAMLVAIEMLTQI